MTCGSKKHIEEALAKIMVEHLEEPQDHPKAKPEPKSKRIKMLLKNG